MATNEADKRDVSSTARYIETLAKELRTMAAEARLDFLAYLLAMVEKEADAVAQQAGDPQMPAA